MTNDLLTALSLHWGELANLVVAVGGYLKNQKALMTHYGGNEKFLAEYPVFKEATDHAARKKVGTDNALARLKEHVPRFFVVVLVLHYQSILSYNIVITTVKKIIDKFSLKKITLILNTVLYRRRLNKKKRFNNFPNPTD